MENKENGIDLISNCIRLFANQEQIQACKENLQDHGLDFIRLAQIFALAGSEARLKILYLLEQEKELCPCDLSDILQMTIPAVSQHLRKLKDANIVQIRKSGQTIFYSVRPNQLGIIKTLFLHFSDQQNVLV